METPKYYIILLTFFITPMAVGRIVTSRTYQCFDCTVIYSLKFCKFGTCTGEYCVTSFPKLGGSHALTTKYCAHGSAHTDGCTTDLFETKCFCRGDYCNGCLLNPCKNGGACSMNGTQFVCQCMPGYTGQRCENQYTTTTAIPVIVSDFSSTSVGSTILIHSSSDSTTTTSTKATSTTVSSATTSSRNPKTSGTKIPLPSTTSSSQPKSTGSVSTTASTPSVALSNLANVTVTADNLNNVLKNLSRIVSANTDAFNHEDIYYVSTILNETAQYPLTNQDFSNFMQSLDNVTDVVSDHFKTSENLHGSCHRMLKAVDTMLTNLETAVSVYDGNQIILQSQLINCKNGSNSALLGLAENDGSAKPIYDQSSISDTNPSVFLPKEIVCTGSRTAFALFKNFKLFQASDSKMLVLADVSSPTPAANGDPCSPITMPASHGLFQAKLIGHDRAFQSKLSEPVQLRFAPTHKFQHLLHASFQGGFWADSVWSTEGCYLVHTSYNIYHFECTHLTDFTLLVDMTTQDPALCDATLHLLGTICCSISFASLVLLIFLFAYEVIVYQRRRRRENFIRLYFLFTLAIFYLLFILLSDSNLLNIDDFCCNVVAAIIYTFLLSVLVQTIVKALDYFAKFYLVLNTRVSTVITGTLLTTVPTLALPATICTILWISISDFFNRGDSFCWIRPDYVIFAVVIPISVIILADVVLSALLAWNFFKPARNRMQHNRSKIFWRKIVLLISMQIILGLPWVLQYFTLGAPHTTFMHHLFTIFNALQGFLISIISILERKAFVKSVISALIGRGAVPGQDHSNSTWRIVDRINNVAQKLSQTTLLSKNSTSSTPMEEMQNHLNANRIEENTDL